MIYRRPVPKIALFAVLSQQAWSGGSSFAFQVISSRPGSLTGGDALIAIDIPENLTADRLAAIAAVKLNGREITGSFRSGTTTHRFVGLVTGLKLGPNSLDLFRRGESAPAAHVSLTNFPKTGPVFSGPHEQPFICQTADFKLPGDTLLGPPLDANCSVETVVAYVYRPVDSPPGAPFKPVPDRTSLPSDVAMTTTTQGHSVPYIVRVETGTINRAIYQIALLHNPVSEPEPDPFTPLTGWNKRLLYSFGGGCTGGWFKQGLTTGITLNTAARGSLTDKILGAGYAYVSSTLNVFGNNCQDVTAAETMMMVKEHFIETYGAPLFTFGRGGSGGAYQQIQIADNYPGLLDGIIPSATFPDVLATIQFLTDAQLLNAYYSKTGGALSDEQKRAVAGVAVMPSVTKVSSGAGRINPQVFCPAELPEPLRYHPLTNPSGARCDVFDHTVNVYGRDPATGFARRPLDNTGVQYGLAQLNAGVITPSQFLDLNEHIGGYDNDGNIVAVRTGADPLALRAAYATGRVTNGGGGLRNIPIIDLRGYLDRNPNGDLHLKYHSFAFRERLIRANGTALNQVLVVGDSASRGLEEYAISRMDEWLTNLASDKSGYPLLDRIVRARPADLADSCYSPSGARIPEVQTISGGECSKLYPAFPSPRMVAGGPVTNDVLKCQLKPVDMNDYRVAFSDSEKARLAAIFAGGVCDWTKPGVEQIQLSATWQSF
jgi:hypothetical protein